MAKKAEAKKAAPKAAKKQAPQSLDELGSLVVSSKVKKAAKVQDENIRFGKDAREELSFQVGSIICKAVDIAVEANMGTVKERHVKEAVKRLFAVNPSAS